MKAGIAGSRALHPRHFWWQTFALLTVWLAVAWTVLASDLADNLTHRILLSVSSVVSLLVVLMARSNESVHAVHGPAYLTHLSNPPQWGWLLAALIALVSVASVVLVAFPNSGDEYAYVLQAETYAKGRLWVEAPELADVFRQPRFLSKDGIWVSQYQPGWALLLAPAAVLRLPPWLVNPVVGVALLYAFFKLTAQYASRQSAWLATVTLGTSAFFLLNLGSFFSHGACALAAVASSYCVARFLRHGTWPWALAAGILAGYLGLTRVLAAIVLLIPVTTAILLTPGRRAGVVALAAGGVPFLAGLLAFNNAVTGDPLLFIPNWFRPGGEPVGVFGTSTIVLTIDRLLRLGEWTSPVLVASVPAAFVWLAWRRHLAFVDWIAPVTVVAFLFYGGNGGDQYGPRYYFEAWPFALLTIARAVDPVLVGQGYARQGWTASALMAVVLLQLAYLPGRFQREHRVVVERQEPFRLVRQAGITHAVVLIDVGGSGQLRPMPPPDLTRNGLNVPSQPVVYAMDIPGRRQALRALFPDRAFYFYSRGSLQPVP